MRNNLYTHLMRMSMDQRPVTLALALLADCTCVALLVFVGFWQAVVAALLWIAFFVIRYRMGW